MGSLWIVDESATGDSLNFIKVWRELVVEWTLVPMQYRLICDIYAEKAKLIELVAF